MTTETKSVAQQLVDIIMPSNEHARSEAVIRIEAALEAAERAGAEMEREACARVAEEIAEAFHHDAVFRSDDDESCAEYTGQMDAARHVAEEIRKRGAT